MRQSDRTNMKNALLFSITIFVSSLGFTKDSINDKHTSIYTDKLVRIVNAMNLGRFDSEDQYFSMLKTACQRNQCSPLEHETITNIGQQIVGCQIKHLKAHGIINQDATSICESKQAIFGCDSLATSLLRKMCYSGNNYSMKVWRTKEMKLQRRLPASNK